MRFVKRFLECEVYMEFVIKNHFLEATINSHGAELVKLVDSDGVNRMHTPTADTWNRVSPILFPQISRMPNSEYMVNGTVYNMTTHGFIRDSELELVNHTETEITFKYSENDKTLIMYPYEFALYVTYVLKNNILEVLFKVENPSDVNVYYMLGGHPGFRVPLYDEESYNDYSLIFEEKETCKKMCVVDGFIANVYEDCLIDTNIIELNHNLFKDDALIFKGLKSKYIDIVSKNHNKKIRFHYSDFDILAIWSKTEDNCNFVCLEPWNGIQKDFVKEHEKMGVLVIQPHDFRKHSFKIEVI